MADQLLENLLREVSRSFYLTMRILPRSIRAQISLAYLLARASDTIADTELVALESRLTALQRLRRQITETSAAPLDFGQLARNQGIPAERTLLERCDEAVGLLTRVSEEDRQRIRAVLAVIISGQELDLTRFGGASPPGIIALETDAELDDYTYRVAGCVGEFWTRTCRAHLFPGFSLDEPWLIANGVRFGKGLQLVNILRDLPRDLQKGRCYLPREALAAAGLKPADLFAVSNQSAARPVYDTYLDRARDHLQAGWNYTNALPAGQVRLRLACAWPILIGVKTLAKLRRFDFLDSTRPIKISRREVRGIMARTMLLYPWQPAWKAQFAQETIDRE